MNAITWKCSHEHSWCRLASLQIMHNSPILYNIVWKLKKKFFTLNLALRHALKSQDCYVRIKESNADRVVAEIVVFNQKWVVSQSIRNAKVQNHKAKIIIKSESIIRNQKSECRQNRQGLDRNCYRYQKGVVYNISINWLTSNRLRVKINVLTG